jgi:hypothetical protein
MRAVPQALSGNMGIEYLALSNFETSDEIWSLLFRSLSYHPRVKSLSISYRTSSSAASKTTRMQAVLEMLRRNTVVQAIDLADRFVDVEVYQNSILPRLEMNRTCFEEQR